MKKNCIIFLLVLFSISVNAQTVLWSEDFSTGSYSVTLGGEGNDGTADYFQKTDGTSPAINMTYVGFTGNYFAAQDIDDGGWTGSASPSQLTWTSISIKNYSSLSFSGDFASSASAAIDASDYVKIEYRIDGGSWTNLLAFENDGTTNKYFLEDTDFDGDGDGTALGNQNTANFTKSITGTGNSLDIRITVAVNADGEDFAFDNLQITGTPNGTITVSTKSISGFSYVHNNGPSSENSYTVSATGLVDDLTITPPTNYEISTGTGAGFVATNPITLSQSGGNVSSTTIYVRLKSGLNPGFYDNEDITHTSTGADNPNVTCSGEVGVSKNSDIVITSGWTPSSNIDYASYQSAGSLTTSNSVEVAKFTIRDGGGSSDADGLATILTDITINITNWNDLRMLAVFNSSGTNLAETSVSSDVVSISGLNIQASDNGSADFSIYATYKSSVTDNHQLSFKIISALTNPSGSGFAAGDAGGATTSTMADYNRIEVTATDLDIMPDFWVTTKTDFNVDVSAVDANFNLDADATQSITLTIATGTGSLSSATGLTQSLSGGRYSWFDVQYDAIGDFTIEAQCASLTNAISGPVHASGDQESDIIVTAGFTEPAIDYSAYSAASGLTTSNALKVASFTIRDGGSDNTDNDGGYTKLTDIEFDVENYQNIKALAIFDGTTNKSEVTTINSSTVSFSGVDITAADEGTKDFYVYATFNTSVTDNENIKFTITNAIASDDGSGFANFDAGGAATDNTGTHNQIQVTADRLDIVFAPGQVIVDDDFSIDVTAVDANGNQDDDANQNVTLAVGSGSGSLTSTSGLTQALSNGYVSWFDLRYDKVETFTIEAQCATLTNTTSNSIVCNGSSESDIIKDPTWSENSIDYASYSAASGLTVSNSIDVAAFRIRDGGAGGSDADGKSTTLTSLQVTIDNWEYIKAIAIFDGGTNLKEVTSVSGSTVTFSGISGLAAADDSYKDFRLFATFNSSVTDNTNIKITISSATAASSGSDFAAGDAGGAATDNTGTNNQIQVTATKMIFKTGPSDVIKSEKMSSVVVDYVDANGNVDMDIAGSGNNVSLTSTGTFDGSATTTATPVSGEATFSNIIYSDAKEGATITASSASSSYSNITSSSFDVGVNPASGVVFISEVSDASSTANEFMELYNSGSDVCILSNATLQRCNSAGDMQASWSFSSDLNSLGDIKIPAGGFLVIARGATSKASFESEWGSLSSSANFNKGTSGMWFGSSTQWRWKLVYDDGSKATQIVDDTDGPVGGSGNDSKQNDDGTWTTTSSTTSSNPGSLSGDDPLPVELIKFTAVTENDHIKILWQTVSEINNDYFILETSSNGIDFESLDRIQGAGNSNVIVDYNYSDRRNISGIVYYRLKQVDFDGKSSYGKVISVDINKTGVNLNKVYYDGSNLIVDVSGPGNSFFTMEIISADGKIVRNVDIIANKNRNIYKIEAGNNLHGVFLIRLTGNNTLVTKRIVL